MDATVVAGEILVFGRVPHPPCDWRPMDEARKPSGWSRLGPRRIVGTCVHRMEGTLRGTEQHFLSNDTHGRDALTDYGIGGVLDGVNDGAIWGWLLPGDDRAPWANGPADHLEGDGPAFVRRFGVAAVNRDLRSIELSGHADTPISPAQFEALCQLVAHIHDRAGVPWHQFPLYPASGVVTQMQHWEFSGKACPFGVVRGATDRYQNRVRAILRAAQTGSQPEPDQPPPTPVEPRVPYAHGQDLALARWQFGKTARAGQDGRTEGDDRGAIRWYRFDPAGVISNAWLERAHTEGEYPAVRGWRTFRDRDGHIREAVHFANGWTLWRPLPGAGWYWLGRDEGAE